MKLHEFSQLGYKNKNLTFWLAMIESSSLPIEKNDVVLDFGRGSGIFLQLLYEYSPYSHGYGIDIDAGAIKNAVEHLGKRKDFPFTYQQTTPEDLLKLLRPDLFDIILCQEVFWMNKQFSLIADTLFQLLKPRGSCCCTVGCHSENPQWLYGKLRMDAEGYESHTNHLDEIAHVFSAAGFSVGMRRLPLDGFIMFHPETTTLNTGSLPKLVSTSYEHKMLFYFGKTERVGASESIHD
jgi:SAM-dependent methyltransferase